LSGLNTPGTAAEAATARGIERAAQQIETLLGEFDPTALDHVGGGDAHVGPSPRHVGEGAAFEQHIVEPVGEIVAAAVIGTGERGDTARTQHPAQGQRLQVPAQRALRVVGEDVLAMQRVIGRGETAAGDRGNEIDLAQQRGLAAVDAHGLRAQRIEQVIRGCGRAHAAAGKGQAEQQGVGIALAARHVLGAILGAAIGAGRKRRITRRLQARTAGQQRRRERNRRRDDAGGGAARAWHHGRSSGAEGTTAGALSMPQPGRAGQVQLSHPHRMRSRSHRATRKRFF
jgi:hypothetical protein